MNNKKLLQASRTWSTKGKNTTGNELLIYNISNLSVETRIICLPASMYQALCQVHLFVYYPRNDPGPSGALLEHQELPDFIAPRAMDADDVIRWQFIILNIPL